MVRVRGVTPLPSVTLPLTSPLDYGAYFDAYFFVAELSPRVLNLLFLFVEADPSFAIFYKPQDPPRRTNKALASFRRRIYAGRCLDCGVPVLRYTYACRATRPAHSGQYQQDNHLLRLPDSTGNRLVLLGLPSRIMATLRHETR